jgi:hypothetical protein
MFLILGACQMFSGLCEVHEALGKTAISGGEELG